MKVPRFLVRWLLRVHERAQDYPYFHLTGYMLRHWIIGDGNESRNKERTARYGSASRRRESWLYQMITDMVAVRAHTILRSDADRHLHNHPFDSISIILEGGYWEVGTPGDEARRYPDLYEAILDILDGNPDLYGILRHVPDYLASFNIHWRGPGDVVFRRASDFHRLLVPHGTWCKSIFIMGPKTHEWGFDVDGVFVPWKQYLGAQ